jgi:circadian clock protein KaiC
MQLINSERKGIGMEGSEKSRGRLSTGIEGLDAITYGGIPESNQVIVAGGPGCGKTLLTFEILYNNAKKGIPCTYLTLEESQQNVLQNFKSTFPNFSDIDALIEEKKIILAGNETASKVQTGTDSQSYAFSSVLSDIEDIVHTNNSKCLVIDSLSILKLMLGDVLVYRKSMFALSLNLKRLGVTSFLTMEMQHTTRQAMSFSPEFFIFDGTIVMYQSIEENKRVYGLEVLKMRGSNHSMSVSPYEITDKGFRIFTISEI